VIERSMKGLAEAVRTTIGRDGPGVSMNPTPARPLPEGLGFRSGPGGVHESRTIMLEDLGLLFDAVPADAPADRYVQAILDDNALGKATRSTRLKTARCLIGLYALDPARATFRLLRRFWGADRGGQPMLAYLAATARDPLLRECAEDVLGVPHGRAYDATAIALTLSERHRVRFRATTLRSTARNLASSWTQAGYLTGRVAKRRSRPAVTPPVVAYALVLGYLAGLRGRMLLDSWWARLLDRPPAEVMDLAAEASKQGWLLLQAAGPVVAITFPGLLTPAEERLAHEPD
jgi:hypothetical protein